MELTVGLKAMARIAFYCFLTCGLLCFADILSDYFSKGENKMKKWMLITVVIATMISGLTSSAAAWALKRP